MDDGTDILKQITHYYHANADAFGGEMVDPKETLSVLAQSSLPVVGGHAKAAHTGYKSQGGTISIGKATSEVLGEYRPATQSFHTMVRASIEDVDIGGELFAKEIVVQIVTEHPLNGLYPSVSFDGTKFDGLRTKSCELNPVLNLKMFELPTGQKYPSASNFDNPNFRAYAAKQSAELVRASSPLVKNAPVFQRLYTRHSGAGPNSPAEITKRGNVICSVVDVVDVVDTLGRCPDLAGHVLAIPNFGRVFLGELIVDHDSFDLNMLRLDMGSTHTGSTSGPHGSANGTTT